MFFANAGTSFAYDTDFCIRVSCGLRADSAREFRASNVQEFLPSMHPGCNEDKLSVPRQHRERYDTRMGLASVGRIL